MRLRYRIPLICLPLLALSLLALLWTGMTGNRQLAYSLQEQRLETQLKSVRRSIETLPQPHDKHLAAREAANLLAQLRDPPSGLKTARLYLIESPDRVIFHPEKAMGEHLAEQELTPLLTNSQGVFDHDSAGKSRHTIVYRIPPLSWVLVLSVDRNELLARGSAYRKRLLLTALAALSISVLLLFLFSNHRSRPSHAKSGRSYRAAAGTPSAQQEQEVNCRQLIARTSDGIWIQDEHRLTTFVNDHFADMLGYTREELLSLPGERILFQEKAPGQEAEGTECLPGTQERRLRHRDGTAIWTQLSVTPIFDASERFRGCFSIIRDITKRRQTEQKLAANEQLFRTLVENSPDYIGRYDRELRRLYLNPSLRKLFQSTIAQPLAYTPLVASPLQDPNRYMQNIRKAFDTAREQYDEMTFRHPDGTLHWASMRFAPEFGHDGQVLSVLTISHDITNLKQAEMERQEHLHFLENLDRINQVLQEEGDIERIMNKTFDEMLDLFNCDRVYLLYPCDPQAPAWSVPFERNRSTHPGVLQLGLSLPPDDYLAWLTQRLLDSNHPVQLGPGAPHAVAEYLQQHFGVLSMLAMALYPRIDSPWQLGIHLCSHDHQWTPQEVRLFEEIGHRVSDRLNNLLITRNLQESEQRFRLVFENSPLSIQEEDFSQVKLYLEQLRPQMGADVEAYLSTHAEVVQKAASLIRLVDANRESLALHEAQNKEEMLQGLTKTFISETAETLRHTLAALLRGETDFQLETQLQTLTGRRQHVMVYFTVTPGHEQSLSRVLVSHVDITDRKLAEQAHRNHLNFLESLDRVNLAIQGSKDLEQMMNDVLSVVLDTFHCDRAYLQYPCDPDADSWWIVMERCRPEHPAPVAPMQRLPMESHIADTLRALLARSGPLRLGGGKPIPEPIQAQFDLRSMMALALRPQVDRPWQFGIHQCDYDRIWTEAEERLFEEIGRRLTDSLNSLLTLRSLRQSEARFRLVFENSPVPIWEEDFSTVKVRLDGLKAIHKDRLEAYLRNHPDTVREIVGEVRIVNLNKEALELHAGDNADNPAPTLAQIFTDESYDAFCHVLAGMAQGDLDQRLDSVLRRADGERREVSVYFSVCPGYENTLSKVLVSRVDITERKQTEERLRLAASVFATSHEGILISDADNRIIDINPAFTQLTGFSREEALGRDPRFLSSGRQSPEFYERMWKAISTLGEWQGELWNRKKSGDIYPEQLSIVAVKDNQGQLQHYVGAFTDISLLKQHEADLDRIAHYDMLTSVPNRRLLNDRLEQALARARRHGKNLAVCYLDLDGFKPINDQYGHDAGDQMLIEIAHRLQSMSRGDDTVARLGGDEFVLLWNDIADEADCARALERILSKVSEPIALNGEPASVSASIGVTLYPDDPVDAESLLRHADHAMYTAKQLGKNCFQIFDSRLERQITAQSDLLAKVAHSLEQGHFELYYQPKVDVLSRCVVGAEALLRWNDPILGLLEPDEFLSLIEGDNLALRMGRWVIERSMQQAKAWHDMGMDLPISINIFPRHLKYHTFIDDLRQAIDSYWPGMPPHRLLLEIVETSAAAEALEPVEEVIQACQQLGVGFSLDDFGTGYSSLVYLRRLSLEELKIDRAFVRDMLKDPGDKAIVVSVIGLGKAFGLRVVAEGVETKRQANALKRLGCTIAQGYGMGRPMPAWAFQKWYANYPLTERT